MSHVAPTDSVLLPAQTGPRPLSADPTCSAVKQVFRPISALDALNEQIDINRFGFYQQGRLVDVWHLKNEFGLW